jgi:hypothetical protein
MSKEKIYVHTSDIKVVKELKYCDEFRYPSEYPATQYEKLYQNEYGKISLRGLDIHVLVGRNFSKSKKCPWCDTEVELKFKKPRYTQNPLELGSEIWFHFECPSCHSRGPIVPVQLPRKEYEQELDPWIEDFLLQKYDDRIPWDKDILDIDYGG